MSTICCTFGFVSAVPSDIHLNGGIDIQGTTFHRGDIVKLYGWSNANQDWKAGIIQVSGALFDVNITGPDGRLVLEKNFTADENGSIAFSLPITNDFQFGKYTVNYAVSKEGYNVHQFGGPTEFFVSRQESDIVEAKGYDFKLLIDPEIKYQSYPKLQISICPSPNVLNNESFVDPTTGQAVDPSHGLVIYHLILPNGTETDKDQYGGTLFNWFDSSTCPNSQIESNFYANMGGNWSAYAVAKWISNGTMYEMQSKPASFHVTEPQFPVKVTKIINTSNEVTGIDINQDKKFILFTNYASENGKDVDLLWMIHPDGSGLQKIDTGKEFQQIRSIRISPSGDFVLWSGAYYDDSGTLVYGLFVYDLKENKLAQISNGGENPDSVGEFHWTKDNKVAYIAKHWDSVSHDLATNLVIADSSGNVTNTTTGELSSLDLYKDPDSLGQMSVTTQSYPDSGGGAVSIKSSDGYEEKIFEVPNGCCSPSGAAISSDGKTIVFGYNTGVYVATLSKPVTEYTPISQTIPTNESNIISQPNQPVITSEQNQSGIKFASPVNLSIDYKSQNPYIAASGNNVYIVWEDWTSGNSDIYFKKSSDGGKTFEKAVNLSNNDGRSFDPAIAVSGDNFYVAWTDESKVNKGYQNILFAKSGDGGNSFDSPIVLSTKTVFTEVTSNNTPRIAVSGNNVYVLWTVSNDSWENVFLAQSSDAGNNFGDPVDLSNVGGTGMTQQPIIAVSGQHIYAAWQTYDQSVNPMYGVITLAKSDDRGKTFNVANLTDNGVSWDPRLYADGDKLYVAWRGEGPLSGMTFAKSSDDGNTFNSTKIGKEGLLWDPTDKWIGTGGKPYLVFTDETNIFLTKSDDGGNTFGNATNLSHNTWNLDPYDYPLIPEIDVPKNNVFVAWRYTVSPDGIHAPFFTASNDGGNSFSNPVNLSHSSGDTSGPPQMAIAGNHVYVVYTDTIPSGSDVFFVSGESNQTLSDESQQATENNSSSSPNIFDQIFGWIKQIFHWS